MVGPPVVYPASLRYLAKLLGSCCCTHSVLEQLSLLVSTWWLWAYRPVNIELRLGQHIGVVTKPFLNSAPEILEIWVNYQNIWSMYSLDRQWRLESIHTLLLSRSIPLYLSIFIEIKNNNDKECKMPSDDVPICRWPCSWEFFGDNRSTQDIIDGPHCMYHFLQADTYIY